MRFLFICVTVLVTGFSVSQADSFGPAPNRRCEPLEQDSCRQFYNETVFPNGFLQYTQDEAKFEMSHYRLGSVNCSDEALFLLCALYFPICNSTDSGSHLMVLPCRSVCQRVRDGCEKFVLQMGSSWPDRLSCDNLPIRNESSGVYCISSENETEEYRTPTPTNCAMRGGTCSQDEGTTAVAVTVVNTRYLQDCSDPLMPSNSGVDSFAGLSYCRAPCTSLYDNDELKFVSNWILGCSCVCLAAVMFSLILFFTNKEKFKDIERPVIYLTCCYVPIAVAYIIGFNLERTSVACYGTSNGVNSLNQTAQRTDDWNGACIVTFLLTYYFGMAANSWWIVLTLYWCLAACNNWDVSRLPNCSSYFHIFAWSVPLIQVAIALGCKGVDGDILSNTCFPGNANLNFLTGLVLAPLFLYLILGSVFFASGLVAAGRRSYKREKVNRVQLQNMERLSSDSQRRLVGQRSSYGSDSNSRIDSTTDDKKGNVPTAAAIYSLLYLFIVALLLLCVMYEQQSRLTWEKSLANCLVKNAGCDSRSRPPVGIHILKYLVTLVGAVVTAMWMWCSKWSCKDCKGSWFNWTAKQCVRTCQGPQDDVVSTSV